MVTAKTATIRVFNLSGEAIIKGNPIIQNKEMRSLSEGCKEAGQLSP